MPSQAYFTKDLFAFLSELREHNDRDWFQSNKGRYEKSVRDPFLALIGDLAPVLAEIKPGFIGDPKPNGGSMMRIYRDTRFAKDKTPYKTFAAAHFCHSEEKGEAALAYYLRFEPGSSMLGGGMWMPEAESLKKIRDRIVAEPELWRRVTTVGTLHGDALKKPPAGYDPAHPLIEDIKRKGFGMGLSLTDDEVCGAKLLDSVAAKMRSIGPFVEFLASATGVS